MFLHALIPNICIILPKKDRKSAVTEQPTLPESCNESEEELINRSCDDSDREDNVSSAVGSDDHVMEDESGDYEGVILQTSSDDDYHIMKDGTVIRRRSFRKIIRWFGYGKENDPESYYREQLMLFLPWRNETSDLL